MAAGVFSDTNGRATASSRRGFQALEKLDPRKAQVVEMRYFGGLTAEETASVLNISPQSMHRDWGFAKTWLLREMTRQTKVEETGG